MKVWQALLDRSVTAQVQTYRNQTRHPFVAWSFLHMMNTNKASVKPLRYRDRFAAFGGLGGIGLTMKVWQVLLDLSVTTQVQTYRNYLLIIKYVKS